MTPSTKVIESLSKETDAEVTSDRGFDLVYDGVAGQIGKIARRLLAPAGTTSDLNSLAGKTVEGASHGFGPTSRGLGEFLAL